VRCWAGMKLSLAMGTAEMATGMAEIPIKTFVLPITGPALKSHPRVYEASQGLMTFSFRQEKRLFSAHQSIR